MNPAPFRMTKHRFLGPLLTSVVILSSACTAGGSEMPGGQDSSAIASARWDASRLDTLVRLGREDQAGREALAQAAAAQDTATLFASLRADSARTRWLREAVARDGWPSRTSAGDSAQQAAWLILQHSPDTAWQAAMVPDLERLAATGELPQADVALLTDRILVHRGQPQRYGSQFDMADGRLVPEPVEDVTGLDARRARVGLPPMAEYVRVLAEQTQLPVVWPPRR
jgi:hypothetical protein